MSEKIARTEAAKTAEHAAPKGEKAGLFSRAARAMLNSAFNTYYMPRF
ncbi:hypothetical protein PQJ75_11325 [Rhodoplanes sp. TEM]|uniref:Uncharacterized protein n=1 Tax=Rhodoplanes tepidamans TaxID=200616 RepID=A0ABT5J6V9_RHOTP|nr:MULTISPECIES: hypothetical protein [Rhodoplanes]MDC7785365.1 hypothetical protein [Rhodoplanes tepidamans]MDC7984323.1 hypothetical protein [Rhodoplanes sp. TEM]MDQ0353183.1 hypothetical protein [Rhodoplanes tepidamans]